jgi:hypothetical protein
MKDRSLSEQAQAVFHSVFGLRLRCDRPIPGLPSHNRALEEDVRVWLGRLPPWLKRVIEGPCQPWYVSPYRDGNDVAVLQGWKLRTEAYNLLRFSDGVQFVVDRVGAEIWCSWPESLTVEDAVTHLLGIVLGYVLRLHGTLCLHASAVAIAGRAIAFLGPECAGKSTIAAALAGLGHPVMTDDLVALCDRDHTVTMQPGFPWLRLRPPLPRGLCDARGTSPRLKSTWDGQYLDLDLTQDGYRFQNRPLPLAVIYLLEEPCDEPDAPFIEPVRGDQALIALLANTWATRMLDGAMRAHEFVQLGRLSARVPLRRLHPRRDTNCISGLCDLILNDYQAGLSSISVPVGFDQA